MTNKNPFRRYSGSKVRGAVYNGDALDFLRWRKSETADIIFLDPPFNLGKKYGGDRFIDRRPEAEYGAWLIEILDEAIRILKPGAALYFYHIPQWAIRIGAFLDKHLSFRHWIAVSMKNGFVRGNKLYPAHYALLYYTKGTPTHFCRPKTKPARCRHCSFLLKDYGGYTTIINEKGINLSDIWDDISPVRHKSTKYAVQNELPINFMERIMMISGQPNFLYIDPFAGGGSGVVEAARFGMRFKACDIVTENCQIIDARLEMLRHSRPSRAVEDA